MRMRETSREAFESIQPSLGTVKGKVHAVFAIQGPMTSEEVEEALDMKHQTISASINHLVRDGLLEDSGEKGVTRSGRRAIKWRIKAQFSPMMQDVLDDLLYIA